MRTEKHKNNHRSWTVPNILHRSPKITFLSHHTVVWLGYLVYFAVKKISGNAFLVHRLADSDEIWHDYGYLCVACLLPCFDELWCGGGFPQAYVNIAPGKKEKLGQRPIQISPGKTLRGAAQWGSRNWRRRMVGFASCKHANAPVTPPYGSMEGYLVYCFLFFVCLYGYGFLSGGKS